MNSYALQRLEALKELVSLDTMNKANEVVEALSILGVSIHNVHVYDEAEDAMVFTWLKGGKSIEITITADQTTLEIY